MHPSNVLTAWVLSAHDALVSASRQARLEPRDLAALTLIAEYDGRSIDWLRGRVGLTQSATVRLVDRLQGEALVRRARADGRTIALSVTPEGRARLESWHAARQRALDDSLVG